MLDSADEAAGAYERHGFVLAASVDRDDLRRGRNKNRESPKEARHDGRLV
jgi:hypothetical protein